MKIFFFLLMIITLLSFHSQVNKEMEIDKNELSHSIAIGVSNPISFSLNLFKEDIEETMGFYIDYQYYRYEDQFLKLHIKSSPNYSSPTMDFGNFLTSIEIGKPINRSKKTRIGHGVGPYFKCNIHRSQQGAGTQAFWSSDYFGFGMQYHLFFDFLLKNKLWINALLNLNIGLHQTYENTTINGMQAQEIWKIKTANQQLISIGIKKQL